MRHPPGPPTSVVGYCVLADDEGDELPDGLVVIGGLGSLEGALVGALIVSLVRTAGIQFFPEIELAVLYLIATAVLLIRPTGLFGRA